MGQAVQSAVQRLDHPFFKFLQHCCTVCRKACSNPKRLSHFSAKLLAAQATLLCPAGCLLTYLSGLGHLPCTPQACPI